jgi:hypothetical protein
MSDKKLDLKIDRIVTKSYRIHTQTLNFPTSRILCCDILWNGEINYDKSRNTAFSRFVSSFLARVVMNDRLLGLFTDCGVIHLGDNPSRHSPIVLKLAVGNIPVKYQEKINKSEEASLV